LFADEPTSALGWVVSVNQAQILNLDAGPATAGFV